MQANIYKARLILRNGTVDTGQQLNDRVNTTQSRLVSLLHVYMCYTLHVPALE